ncbi:hypothetical protein N7449_005842 [Penicillium cf. viridicatum]|uniref:Uncharacterized protein n=1 Tax=Penicillium cf. viridicatum TaxID=2972119 RepID=A0A9W9MGU5_9EURO|nr:hypothetical protein N7449_005842 [Penicillium cf. viridicatum]
MSDYSDSPGVECFEALPADTFEAIGSSASTIRRDFLLRWNVPPSIAEKLSSSSTRQMFNYSTQSMTIKLLTGAHDTASRGLTFAVRDAVRDIGLPRSYPVGSKRIQGVSCAKEPDESFSLRQPVTGRDEKWPIIAVEVRVSDAYLKLNADAAWWLTSSQGQVKLVVIVCINRKIPENHCPSDSSSVKFEELFCRQPVPPEHDIEISIDQLKDISDNVWSEQNL